jgi:hypothetical protein
MKFLPISQAGVQQPGGALFDIRCSAIAKEPKTVREQPFKAPECLITYVLINNTAYSRGVCGAGAARRRQRHDQDIHVGSSQSAVQYVHSAMAKQRHLAMKNSEQDNDRNWHA